MSDWMNPPCTFAPGPQAEQRSLPERQWTEAARWEYLFYLIDKYAEPEKRDALSAWAQARREEAEHAGI